MNNKQGKLRIIPIGGLGEVGKNMMAYEFEGNILVVDSGLMFPDNDMLGVDYIIPDFK
jgi:ribonuclease J